MKELFVEMRGRAQRKERAAEAQRVAVRGSGLRIGSYLGLRTLEASFRGVPLRLEQELTEGATGGYLWAGTVRMLERVLTCGALDSDGDVAPLRVLELGSGVGLGALILALAGAAVVATDRASALALLRRNVAAHPPASDRLVGSGGSVRVMEHAWGTAPTAELQREVERGFDLIVACDCVYATHAVEPLVASLVALSTPGRTRLIVANAQRTALEVFVRRAAPHFSLAFIATGGGEETDVEEATTPGASAAAAAAAERVEEVKVRVYDGARH